MTAMQSFFADAFAARMSTIKSTRQPTGRNARRLAKKHAARKGATPAKPAEPYCSVCGEDHANPCNDEFPEPGEMRETG